MVGVLALLNAWDPCFLGVVEKVVSVWDIRSEQGCGLDSLGTAEERSSGCLELRVECLFWGVWTGDKHDWSYRWRRVAAQTSRFVEAREFLCGLCKILLRRQPLTFEIPDRRNMHINIRRTTMIIIWLSMLWCIMIALGGLIIYAIIPFGYGHGFK